MNFLKNSALFLIKFNNLKAIIKQLTALVTRYPFKKLQKNFKKFHEFFKS